MKKIKTFSYSLPTGMTPAIVLRFVEWKIKCHNLPMQNLLHTPMSMTYDACTWTTDSVTRSKHDCDRDCTILNYVVHFTARRPVLFLRYLPPDNRTDSDSYSFISYDITISATHRLVALVWGSYCAQHSLGH